MATINFVAVPTGNHVIHNARWSALAANDDGLPTPFAAYTDRSVQVHGVFGGASVVIEGSNNGGVSWATLTDPEGTPLVLTAAGLKQVTEVALLMRPRVAGGDGSTALNVNFCART